MTEPLTVSPRMGVLCAINGTKVSRETCDSCEIRSSQSLIEDLRHDQQYPLGNAKRGEFDQNSSRKGGFTYRLGYGGIGIISEYTRNNQPCGDRNDAIQLKRHSWRYACKERNNRVNGSFDAVASDGGSDDVYSTRAIPLAPMLPLSRFSTTLL